MCIQSGHQSLSFCSVSFKPSCLPRSPQPLPPFPHHPLPEGCQSRTWIGESVGEGRREGGRKKGREEGVRKGEGREGGGRRGGGKEGTEGEGGGGGGGGGRKRGGRGVECKGPEEVRGRRGRGKSIGEVRITG